MEATMYKTNKIETEYADENCCNLCLSASDLSNQIVEHLQKYHGDSINYENIIRTCNCEEIQELQDLFMNHHLVHVLSKCTLIEEIEAIEEEDIIEEECIDNVELTVDYIEEYINFKSEDIKQDETNSISEAIVYEEYVALEVKNSKDKKCLQCNAEYSSFKGLETHYQNEHDPNNKIKCPECSNRFKCEKKLQTHMNNHEADKSYRDGQYYCRICEKPCVNKARLIAHRKTHFQDYCCDYCGKRFTKFEFLHNHVIQHAYGKRRKDPNDLTGKIVCPLCSKFVPKDRMKRHNFIFHSDERPYVCNIEGCGKAFKYQEPYSNHMDMHNNSPRYKCEYCNKSFYNQSNLRSHMYRHTHPDKFTCEYCNDRFGSSNSLKMHIKRLHETSNDQESFQCTIDGCNKKFKVQANLKNHISQVHNSNDDVILKCEHCPYESNKMKNIQKHTSRVHKIKKRDHRVFPPSN